MLVDSTSVVDEANWLDIDANTGAEPAAAVGVSIISDLGYTLIHPQSSTLEWLSMVLSQTGLEIML